MNQDMHELCQQVRQLVMGFAGRVRDVETVDDVQNTYLHMEELDSNFHRYDIVKSLRASIEETVGHLIDREIERCAPAPGHTLAEQEMLVKDITSRVLNSQKYGELRDQVCNRMKSACDHLLQNFDQEFHSSGSDAGRQDNAYGWPQQNRQQPADIFSDAEDLSTVDSLNQSAVLFMNGEQQNRIAYGLSRSNNIDMRKNAMHELLLVTNLDFQNCEAWPVIRTGVTDALSDDNESLWSMAMKFVVCSLGANCHEVYFTLVDFLHAQFSSLFDMPTLQDGLDITKARVVRIFKAFRLIDSFLKNLLQHGQRYQKRTLNDLLEPTLALLDTSHQLESSNLFSPMHFLALVDHKAHWFVNLMHGQFSRSCLLKSLENHKKLVESAARVSIHYISCWTGMPVCDTESKLPFSQSRLCYTKFEVEIAHLMHSLHLVGQLIRYEQGRQFFPVRISKSKEPVSITDVVVALVQLAVILPESYKPDVLDVDPHRLAVEIIKKLCISEDVCHKVICNDAVTSAILSPLKRHLDRSGRRLPASVDQVVGYVTDILLSIASTRCGRLHLLYGKQTQDAHDLPPVHAIVKFALKSLGESSPCEGVSGLLHVCRLLYHTCDGLHIVAGYGLHRQLAGAWRDARREADNVTPTPGVDVHPLTRWEQQLRDDLLNFAGTPKGVFLLQQTEVLSDCVELMFLRYEHKLQVSSCEKFGYGYMMSQVAATAPGILALDSTGFTGALIKALWRSLEVDDGSPHVPRCWPVSPIDKLAKKPFINIVNLLSSFLPVYEILEHSPHSAHANRSELALRRIPTTVNEMLERLVFVETDEQIRSLFNYEQSHVFGLRLLSALTSCLDTMLVLQDKYSFKEMLLKCQANNTTDDGKSIILDVLSLERNYILVKTSLVGGQSERCLPPRTLNSNSELGYPLFSSYPVPNDYLVKAYSAKQSKDDKTSELSKFLSSSKRLLGSQQLSLDRAQTLLIDELTNKVAAVDGRTLFDLLEKVVDAMIDTTEAVFPQAKLSGDKKHEVPAAHLHGISLVIQYGRQLQLLPSDKDVTDKLTRVIRKLSAFFAQQQSSELSTNELVTVQSTTVGFDWFASTVFLMASGNADRTEKFLSKFCAVLSSGYVWMKRLHGSARVLLELTGTGIPPACFIVCHHVEHILQVEVPHVYSTFRMSGYSPAQICQQWIRQCFWNYLDWPQVCEYISVCVVLGADYTVYSCVAVLRHLQRDLMQHMQNKNLVVFLKEEPIRNFRFGDNVDYMRQLKNKYGDMILSDMRSIVAD